MNLNLNSPRTYYNIKHSAELMSYIEFSNTLFLFCKNIVFSAQAEYSCRF